MNRLAQIKSMREKSHSRSLQVSFHSLREKRRYLSPSNRFRKGGRPRRHEKFDLFKSSSKIRELVAPEASKKYEIAIFIKRSVEKNSISVGTDVRNYIIDVLRDLIPNQFKVIHEKEKQYYYKRPEKIYIKRIYLKNELDLCIVQIAIQQYIWRVMRVVSVKSIKSET